MDYYDYGSWLEILLEVEVACEVTSCQRELICELVKSLRIVSCG